MDRNRGQVGIGWRAELSASIYAHLDEIDLIEVVAENYFNAPRRERLALKWLAQQVPVYIHGVSMGLASTHAVSRKSIDAMARLVNDVEPRAWSEHLAFVRTPGIEIGHMAAPPRNDAVIEATLDNLSTVRRSVGSSPLLENIATLVEPPGSCYSEAQWVTLVADACDTPLLLDLHNLYANAVNCGRDPLADLLQYPLNRVSMVHLSGGVYIQHESGATRLLDDHLHDVPPQVLELLTALAQHTRQPLQVLIERDGRFPPFEELRQQMQAARAAVAVPSLHPAIEEARVLALRGPQVQMKIGDTRHRSAATNVPGIAATRSVERAFATLLTDRAALQSFLNGDDTATHADVTTIDHIGLELAASSYAHKREQRSRT